MKIAIITSGILPVPAVQGGAVENLVDFYLDFNDKYKLHDITIYSVFHSGVIGHPALKSNVNHYKYIDTNSLSYKIRRKLYSFYYKGFYNYFIEFFFENVYKQMAYSEFDLIILENRPAFVVKLSRRVPIPVIAHVHFDILNNPKLYYIFENLKGIISVSDFLYSKTSETIRRKCLTVHNGIDLSVFKLLPDYIRKANRKSYDILDEDIVLIYTGRISPIKGVKELIEAITILKDKNIKLLIIGSAHFGDEGIKDIYMETVSKVADQIRDQIIFTGYRPYSEIPAFLSLGDIAVVPSICNDAFPTSILEAMAAGLPIIASNRGGIPEQIDASNAILVDTDTNFVSNLSRAIYYLSHNKFLMKEMSMASFRKSKQFQKDIFARDFFLAINHLCNRNT